MNSTKLAKLEAILDAQLFRQPDEEDEKRKKPILGRLGKLAVGVAAVEGAQKLKGRYDAMTKIPNAQEALAPKSMLPKIGQMKGADRMKQYGKAAAADLTNIASRAKRSAGIMRKSFRRSAGKSTGVVGRMVKAAKTGIKMYEANIARRIVELDARLDELSK